MQFLLHILLRLSQRGLEDRDFDLYMTDKSVDIIKIDNLGQIKDLQDSILRPILLRRMKEDVEKSIPLKEEVILLFSYIYLGSSNLMCYAT